MTQAHYIELTDVLKNNVVFVQADCSCKKFSYGPISNRDRVLLASQAHTRAMYMNWLREQQKVAAAQERAAALVPAAAGPSPRRQEPQDHPQMDGKCADCTSWCPASVTGEKCNCGCWKHM